MIEGPDRNSYLRAKPIRVALPSGTLEVRGFELADLRSNAYVDPFVPLEPPPAELFWDSTPLSSFEALATLLLRSGVYLAREAVGHATALSELFLVYTELGHPFWSYRFGLYGPGEFEHRFGIPSDGGRARVEDGALIFWSWGNLLCRRHLDGFRELRWDLRTLRHASRKLASMTRERQ